MIISHTIHWSCFRERHKAESWTWWVCPPDLVQAYIGDYLCNSRRRVGIVDVAALSDVGSNEFQKYAQQECSLQDCNDFLAGWIKTKVNWQAALLISLWLAVITKSIIVLNGKQKWKEHSKGIRTLANTRHWTDLASSSQVHARGLMLSGHF